MDNLVNIYKSMEVASGINIFGTQNVSQAKLSGKWFQFIIFLVSNMC